MKNKKIICYKCGKDLTVGNKEAPVEVYISLKIVNNKFFIFPNETVYLCEEHLDYAISLVQLYKALHKSKLVI